MKLLVFDNYDSFTYNLVQLVERIARIEVEVRRNDQVPMEEIKKYDKIILSPGPGIPAEAGSLLPLIREYGSTKSILGVCLGHQAIGETYGGTLTNLSTVYHGVATPITIDATNYLFRGLPASIAVGRYHSWVVERESFPEALEITATDEQGYVMALQHRTYDVAGVQFHPESVLTPDGEIILRNWLNA